MVMDDSCRRNAIKRQGDLGVSGQNCVSVRKQCSYTRLLHKHLQHSFTEENLFRLFLFFQQEMWQYRKQHGSCKRISRNPSYAPFGCHREFRSSVFQSSCSTHAVHVGETREVWAMPVTSACLLTQIKSNTLKPKLNRYFFFFSVTLEALTQTEVPEYFS